MRKNQENEIQITFQPSGRRVFVLPGTILLEAAARAGFIVGTPCGGKGTCGKCRVKVIGGCKPSETEIKLLGRGPVDEGWRLACLAKVCGPSTVEIPSSSLFTGGQKILESGSGAPVEVKARITKRYIEMTAPSHEDAKGDLERIKAVVGDVESGITVLRHLPGVLRKSGFKVTAVLRDRELIAVEPGDTTARLYGVAFDIGTTTVVCSLVDLVTGEDLAVSSGVNPQTSFGDDVITRITKCRQDVHGLSQLHGAILEMVRQLVTQACEDAEVDPLMVYEAVFAGNTAMQEILCGIDPSPLGEMPFVLASRKAVSMTAMEFGLNINPEASVRVFPEIGGFVGGDTVAGIVAARLDEYNRPVLLVDIGTNGEIVLASGGKMLGTSVAAGPAFEGARIINGMRAVPGAIEKVVIDDAVHCNIIGDMEPVGICGTGMVDAVAGMLRAGLLDEGGRIQAPSDLDDATADKFADRLVKNGEQYDFMLYDAEETATGEPIMIHQRDVRELQLANGAIRAGISILLRMAGIGPGDLEAVLVAGGFGNFIRRKNARRIGMLPAIPTSRIMYIGNAALFGARRVLLSTIEEKRASSLAEQVIHVDLSLDPDFQMEFGSAMIFPDSTVDAGE